MWMYPGHTGFRYPTLYANGMGPEFIKAWRTHPIQGGFNRSGSGAQDSPADTPGI